ncbi:MAG: SDR family NAD(P)-dependent oxidoreductase [Thiobacillus sp.]|nr:SDR family NAD(P)-dependent oxidoreductase [Thiobacillus sp.]
MKNYSPRPDLLAGRVILVTGASSGLGRAASLAFARHGATVALLARNEARLEVVYDEILAAGGPEPAMFPYDLASADDRSLETLAGAIAQHLKRLDGVLHSAHQFYSLTPLELQTLEQWQALMRVNLIAPFALTRACLPLLKQAPDASVVFTGETHGHQPSAYWGGYAVAKSGLETLTRIWTDELGSSASPRINTLIPGQAATTLRSRTHPGLAPETVPSVDDLMPWYLYLMGADSRAVRGQIVECQT